MLAMTAVWKMQEMMTEMITDRTEIKQITTSKEMTEIKAITHRQKATWPKPPSAWHPACATTWGCGLGGTIGDSFSADRAEKTKVYNPPFSSTSMPEDVPAESFEALKIQDQILSERIKQCQAQRDQLLRNEQDRNRAAAQAREEKLQIDKEIQLAQDTAKNIQQAYEEKQKKFDQDKHAMIPSSKGKDKEIKTSTPMEETHSQGRLDTLLLAERVSQRLLPLLQVLLLLPLDPNLQ